MIATRPAPPHRRYRPWLAPLLVLCLVAWLALWKLAEIVVWVVSEVLRHG